MHISTRLFILLLVQLRVSGNIDSRNKKVEMKQSDNVASVLTTKQPETESTSHVQDASEESDKISTTICPTGHENDSKQKDVSDHINEYETTTPETNTAEPSKPKPTTSRFTVPIGLRIGIIVTGFAIIVLANFFCVKRSPEPVENEPIVNFVQEPGLPLLRRNRNNESGSGDVPAVTQ